MKKTLLFAGLLCSSFIANAQCEAVATLNETFETFANNAPLPQNCWTASEAGPRILSITADSNTALQLYVFSTPTVPFYVVSPELSTIDGAHKLSYSIGAPSAPGVLRIQVGTLSSPTDFTGFTAVGSPVIVNAASTQSDIVIPSSATQKYIAFRIVSVGAPHIATSIDNVVWESTLGIKDSKLSSFNIYPNPSADRNITVSYDSDTNASEKNNISVYNLTGTKVFETDMTNNSGSNMQNLNLSALSSGIYIMKLQSGKNTATKKLILK